MATHNRALIILLVDTEAYEKESGEKFTADYLHKQGGFANEDAGGMLGYEGWMTIPDAPAELVDQLGNMNYKPEGVE